MLARRFLPWLVLAFAANAAPAMAQFVPRDAMMPFEEAARQVSADIVAPTPAQREEMRALEAEVHIEQPCQSAWDPALEAPRRRLLALYEATYGPDHPATARPLHSLFCNYVYNVNTAQAQAERERIIARLVAIGRQRNQPAVLYSGLDAQRQLLAEKGQVAAMLADATEALALARNLFRDRPDILASSANALAVALEAAGRPAEAEPLFEEAVTFRQALPDGDRFQLASAYEALGNNLTRQLRIEEARVWYARELGLFEAALADADAATLTNIVASSQAIYTADPTRVEKLYRSVLQRQEADPNSSDRRNWMTLWNLAKSTSLRLDLKNAVFRDDLSEAIGYQRRVIAAIGPGANNQFEIELAYLLGQRQSTAAEAEGIFRKALESDPDNPQLIENLASTLRALGRFDEAVAVYERGIDRAVARYGPNHRETLRQIQNLAVGLWMNQRPSDARPFYERVLAGYRAEFSAIPETANAEYRRGLSGYISITATNLLRLYWSDRTNVAAGGNTASRQQGFEVAQLAHPSVSGGAISETAARALAERDGKGPLFAAWAAARDRVVTLDRAVAAAAQQGSAGDADRTRLLAQRAAASNALGEAATALDSALPQVFATLRPAPVPLAEVSGTPGQAPLLRADEALVLLYPGMPDARAEMSRGIVFAVTREGSAWAEIPLDGADLTELAAKLHRWLSNDKFSGGTAAEPGEDPRNFLRYDRSEAWRMYRALFGAPAIADLLQGKSRWVVVPEGPLLGLNFTALVSQAPSGGAAGDVDPATLRGTHWLGLDKVVSVVPTVNALRTARRGPAPAWDTGQFYGIGDPAFRGVADPALPPVTGRTRGAGAAAWAETDDLPLPRQRLYRDGAADLETLADLPRLTFSAAEVEQMGALLKAPPGRQFFQLDATQGRVEQGSVTGLLEDSGVVLFATHALLGGSFDGTLAEPALALTPRIGGTGGAVDPNDDGLLTASEIAQLRFDSALVILSACNTAAGSEGGDGFSGLTRAFLLAGARAVMATHSPVVDEVGARLTTSAVELLPEAKGDVAAALHDAMRAIALDPSQDASGYSLAHPAAWAVYVAIDPS